jgi:predicted amino acid dehydrogenase
MLGVELDLDSPALRGGLLGYLADQKLLTYLVSSYLLNVEKIRVTPTESAESVLRVEPPLIFDWDQCQVLLDGLGRTLDVLARGNTARLVGHLVGAPDASGPATAEGPPVSSWSSRKMTDAATPSAGDGRFAFLVHFTEMTDFIDLDPSLSVLTGLQLLHLRTRGAELLSAAPLSEVIVESRTGQRAFGEFIAVPYTARELIEMPRDAALSEIRRGVELAQERGALIVGLGGFTSVATLGGLALKELGLGPLTTGNSYTVASARRGVRMACEQANLQLSRCCVAVIGATGAIGRATSLLVSEDVGRLMLVGNPAHPERTTARLLEIAATILIHLWKLHTDQQREFAPRTLGAAVVSRMAVLPARPSTSDFTRLAEDLNRCSTYLTVTTDHRRWLPEADVAITATNAVEGLLEAEYLKHEAIVCEISRPFNATPEVRASRPDVRFVEGGLIRLPSQAELGWGVGHRSGAVFACMAETMMLALEHRYQDTSLGPNLDLQHILELDALADKHGFKVECGWGR